MIFLHPPLRDYRADFRTVSNGREAAVALLLNSASRNVFRSYDRYISRSADAARLRCLRSATDTLAALKSNYPVLRNSSIYGELLQIGNGHCPMCGFGEVSTLDHYLPQSRFPQFSVFGMNLVPACARCNQLKGHWVGTMPDKQFLHAFFHQIPATRILTCRVRSEAGMVLVTFRIRQTQRLAQDVLSRLNYQFARLELGNRLRREALNELGSRRAVFANFVGPHNRFPMLRDQLRQEARGFLATLGPNHWKTALYTALRQSRPFWSGGFRNLR